MSEEWKFAARYPGRCMACHDAIEVGDDLVMQDGLAVHFDCAGNRGTGLGSRSAGPAGVRVATREVCARCFTEKSVSGACACEEPA
jgi:hypothetical protein